jgi:hypothetical protein
MGEYRLSVEITVQADDEDEALAMAYGALDPALLREATEELPTRPKPVPVNRIVGLTVDVS